MSGKSISTVKKEGCLIQTPPHQNRMAPSPSYSTSTAETQCGDWIIEFLLLHLHSDADWIIEHLIESLPFTKNNPNLHRLILLRKIDSDVSHSDVTARTLKAVEAYAHVSEASEVLTDLLRRVALECALRHLRGSQKKWESFESEVSELIPTRVLEDDIPSFQWRCAAVEELDALLTGHEEDNVTSILDKYKGCDLLKDLHVFVAEARKEFGVSSLEEFAKDFLRSKDSTIPETSGRGVTEENDSVFPRPPWSSEYLVSSSRRRNCNNRSVASVNSDGTQKPVDINTLPTNDQVLNNQFAPKKPDNELSSKSCTTDKESPLRKEQPENGSSSGDCLSEEFRECVEALRKSKSDFRCFVDDPLPKALQLAEEELARKRPRTSRPPNANDIINLTEDEDSFVSENAQVVEQQGEQNARVSAQKDSECHNSVDCIPQDHRSRENSLEKAKASEEMLRRSSKHNLMARNATARTFEWIEDDEPPGLKGKSPSDSKNVDLECQKLKRFPPLKPIQSTGIGLRRKRSKWTVVEEERLKKEVSKYGIGRWKFILLNNRDVFEDRTEVDLKDKWRNIAKRDGIEGSFL